MACDTSLTTVPSKGGIIFFAHGSRDPLWQKPIEAVAQALQQQRPEVPCTCAYLELTEPDLPTACSHLLDAGCTHLTVLPMFLGTGRHARHDLPVLVQSLREKHPHITFEIATTVGEDPRVTQLLASIALQYAI